MSKMRTIFFTISQKDILIAYITYKNMLGGRYFSPITYHGLFRADFFPTMEIFIPMHYMCQRLQKITARFYSNSIVCKTIQNHINRKDFHRVC